VWGIDFHVVCPSIPGYGWSDAATRKGMHVKAVARIMIELMTKLGYNEFYVAGNTHYVVRR
jgi:pimeloyl-ACP methyl ester carboxylesterase